MTSQSRILIVAAIALGLTSCQAPLRTAHSEPFPDICYYRVGHTSDGFLALRRLPTSKSEMIAAMGEGTRLRAYQHWQALGGDGYQGGDAIKYRKNLRDWLRVALGDVEPDYGWVFKKYIKLERCEQEGK
jgi:hypothetical protein